MAHVSNTLLAILNFITFLLSIPILAGGIWLNNRPLTDCEKFLAQPVIAFGVILLLLSLVGFIGTCFKISWLLWLYLFAMAFIIFSTLCFTIYAFAVTNKGSGKSASGEDYKVYRLSDYSSSLQKQVNNNRWNRIKTCLLKVEPCTNINESDFSKPIQWGCCKPPSSCGFVMQNVTFWNNTKNTARFLDTDCSVWSNDRDKLCYDCDSCKAGILAEARKDSRKDAIINIVFLLFLIIVYCVACRAFMNVRAEKSMTEYKPHP